MSYVRYNPSVTSLTNVTLTGSGYTNITQQLLSSTVRTVQATATGIPTNCTVTINWYGSNTTPNVPNVPAPATATSGGVLFATTTLGGAVFAGGYDTSGGSVALSWAYLYAQVTVSTGTLTTLNLTVGV